MKKQKQIQLPTETIEEKIASKKQVLEGRKVFLAECIGYRDERQKDVNMARKRVRETERQIRKLEASK